MRKPLAKLSKAVLMTAAALIACAPPAKAVTYYWWDANTSPNGLGNSSSSSTDNWTSAYWYNGSTTFSAPTGNSATGSLPSSASNSLIVFSGTEGTVSLATTFSVAGIIARSSETIQNSAALTVGSSGIAVASGKTLTITGSLSGNFSLLRNSASTDGGGTLVLSGSRGASYTTTVDAGVLRLASSSSLGIVYLTGGSLELAAGTSSFSLVNLKSTQADSATSGLSFGANQSLSLTAQAGSYYGNLTSTDSTASLVLSGTGTWSLLGDNSAFGGKLGASDGTISVTTAAALGSSSARIAMVPVAAGKSPTLLITGASSFNDTAPNRWSDLPSNVTYDIEQASKVELGSYQTGAGEVSIAKGLIQISGEVSLTGIGTADRRITIQDGAFLAIKGNITGASGNLSVDLLWQNAVGWTAQDARLMLLGDVSLGPGKLTVTDAGSPSGAVGLYGDNHLTTGAMEFAGGVNVYAGSPTALGDGDVKITNATVDILKDVTTHGVFTVTYGTVKSTGTLNASPGASLKPMLGSLVADVSASTKGSLAAREILFNNSSSASVSVALKDLNPLSSNPLEWTTLSKSAAGTATLSGLNSYRGVTTVDAGILVVQNSSALGTSDSGTTITATTADATVRIDPPDAAKAFGSGLYNLVMAEDFVLKANGTANTNAPNLVSNDGINKITGLIQLSAGATDRSGYLSVSAGALYLGPTTLSGSFISGTGAAISGLGATAANLEIVTAATSSLLILGDMSLGGGKLAVNSSGSLALFGDNHGSTGGVKFNNASLTVYAGTPSSLGRGNVDLIDGTLKVNSDVNIGTGGFTLGSSSTDATVGSDGLMSLIDVSGVIVGGEQMRRAKVNESVVSGVVVKPFDVTAGSSAKGSLEADSYNLLRGTISIVLKGGAGGVKKTTTGVVTLSANNTFTGDITVGDAAAPATDAGELLLNGTNLGVGAIQVSGVNTILYAGTSGSLGADTQSTTINPGAQLQLKTVAATANRQTWNQTGARAYDLDIAEPLTIGGLASYTSTGTAANKALIASAALYNSEGINRLTGQITLLGGVVATETTISASADSTTDLASRTGSKLFIDAPIEVSGGTANLTLRAALVSSANNNPGQIEVSKGINLGAGKLTLDTTSGTSGGLGVIALLADNTFTGKAEIGTSGSRPAVVVGAAGAFGQGDVKVTYGDLYVAADVGIPNWKFTLVNGNVYAASELTASTAYPRTTDYDYLAGRPGSITADSYDLQLGAVAVPLKGGAGGVKKTTTGVVTLSANNTFTGDITVGDAAASATDAGELLLNGTNLGVGAIQVSGVNTILYAGTSGSLGTATQSTTINPGAQLQLKTVATAANRQTWNQTGARAYDLDIAEPLTIGGLASYTSTGTAANKALITSAALYNSAGINRLTGRITLLGGVVATETTISASADNTNDLASRAGSKLFIDAPIEVSGGTANLTLRADRVSSGNNNPGQIEVSKGINLGAGKLTLDTTSGTSGGLGVIALLADNTFTGKTEIGTSLSRPAVVVGAAGAFGQGDVKVTYGDLYVAADVGIPSWKFTLVDSNVYAASKLTASTTYPRTTDYDYLAGRPGSITANSYDLQKGSVYVPLKGGAGGLTKTTTNQVTLYAANTYSGLTVINQGVLRINDSGALGASGAVGSGTKASAGTLGIGTSMTLNEDLELAGLGQSNAGAVRNLAGNSILAGGIILSAASSVGNAATGSTLTIASGTPITGSFNLTFSASKGEIVVDRSINIGTGSLTKTDGRSLTLNGVSNYSGTTTVMSSGTDGANRFIVDGALQGAGAITVNANAVFGGKGSVAGSVTVKGAASTTTVKTTVEAGQAGYMAPNDRANFQIGGNLTFGGVSTTGIYSRISLLSPAAYPSTQAGAPLEVAGSLAIDSLMSKVSIDFNGLQINTPGTYHLIKYGNGVLLSATEFNKLEKLNLTVPAGTSRPVAYRPTAVLVSNPGYVDLAITGAVLYWKGEADAGTGSDPRLWQEGGTTLTRWEMRGKLSDGTQIAAGTNDRYLNGDIVNFDDTPALAAPTDILLSANRNPTSVTFNNNSRNYSFSNASATAYKIGGVMNKDGAGMVTFNQANSFSKVGIYDGTIRAGADDVLGPSTTFVAVYGRDDDPQTPDIDPKLPRLSSNSTSGRILNSTFKLNSDYFSIGDAASSGVLEFKGAFNLGGASRTLTIDSDVILSGKIIDDPTAIDSTTIAAAAVASGKLVKRGGGKLTFSANDSFGIKGAFDNETQAYDFSGEIFVEAGSLQIGNGSTTGSVAANINNSAKVIFNGTGISTYEAVLSGTGAMDKLGTGTLTLTGDNTMTGITRLLGGQLNVNGSIAGDLQTSNGTVLGGAGTIKGNVIIAGQHSPGNSPGVQIVSGDLTYATGASIKWELSDNTNVQGDPAVFDSVKVGGNLTFAGSNQMKLDFKQSGSSLVRWTDPFWNSSKQWEVYNVDGTISPTLATLDLTSLLDGISADLHSSHPGATFGISVVGHSVVLAYSAGSLAIPYSPPVTLANTHVGVDFVPVPMLIGNIASPGSDSLDAAITGSLGGKVILSAVTSVVGIAAGDVASIPVSLAKPTQVGPTSDSVTMAYVSQPGANVLAPQAVLISGTAYEYAAPSAPTSVDVGKIRLGLPASAYTAFQAAAVTVANQAASSLYGESLGVAWSTPASSNVSTYGTVLSPIAPGSSSSALSANLTATGVAGIQSGSAALALTSVAVPGSSLGDTVLAPSTVTVSGTAYNAAVGFVALADRTIDLGHVRVGQSFTAKSIQVSNAAVAGSFTESLSALFDSALTDAGLTTTGSVSNLVAGNSDQGMMVNWSQTGTAGTFNKNTTIRMSTSGSGLPTEEVTTQIIQVTATVDAIASIVAPSPVYSGRVHVGGSFQQVDVSVTNGVAGATLENLSVAVKTSALPAGLSGWGSASGLAAGQTSANGIQAQITDTTSLGDVTKVLTISGQSISQNLTLAPIDLPDATVSITGLAYTGKSMWLGGSNGDWTNGSAESDWTRWTRLGGIPGKDGVLSIGDTATFAGSPRETVRLNGLSPELQAIIFNGATGATLTAAASESLALGKGGLLAEVRALAGVNHIEAPVFLYGDLQVTAKKEASVSFAGAITAVSATSFSVLGDDLAALGGTADFSTAVGGSLSLGIQAATLSTSVDQSFGATVLKSGALVSSKQTAGAVNLTVASLEKVASGVAAYDIFMLGDASAPAKLRVGLSSAAYVDVKGGDLRNNASVAAAIQVRSDAALGGIGSSAAVTVSDRGKFAPGNISTTRTSLASGYSFGTYAADSVTLSNSSIFNISINATSNTSLTLVSGPSLLNGQLLVSYFGETLADANVNASSVYTIITNGLQVRNGTFSDVAFDAFAGNAFPTLTPHTRYFSDHVELYFTELVVPGPGVPNASDVSLGSTHVGQAFAQGQTTINNNAPAGYGTITANLTPASVNPAGVLPPATVSGVLPGTSKTADVTLATPTSAGSKTGQILITFVSQPGNVGLSSQVINVTGMAYEYASANVLSSVDLGSIRRGSLLYGTFHAAAVPLTNLATSAAYGEKLSANWQGTSAGYVVTNGSVSNLNPQANSNALSLNLSSALPATAYNETATLRLTSVSLTSDLQDTTTDVVVGVTGRVYNPASGSTSLNVNLGMTRVGTNFQTKPITVTNTAAGGLFTETLKAELLSPTGGVTTSGTLIALQAGQQISSLGIGSTDVATPGAKNGTVTIQYTTEGTVSGLPNEVVGSQSITVTGTVAAPGVLRNDQTARVRSTGTVLANAVDSGRVHVGGSFGQVDVHVKNEQTNPDWVAFTETLAGVTAASSAAGFSYTHATLASLLPTVNDTATYKATITDTVTSGEIFKTLRFSANSISLDGSLAPLVVSPLDVQVMGLAYTGRGAWIASSGNWTSGTVDADWDRWELLGGIPGIDATLSNADTASFGGAGANTVTINAVFPRLKALNFSSVAGTTLGRAGTEHIDLGLGLAAGETVSMSVSGGQHVLQVPVTLHKDLTIDVGAQSKLTFGALVTNSGASSLAVTGTGSVDFFTGLTGATPLNLSLRGATVSTGVNQTLGALDLQSGTLKSSAAGLSGSNVNASSLVKSGISTSEVILGDKITPDKLVVDLPSLAVADIAGGILRVNADLHAPVLVRSGGTLGGNGKAWAVTVLDGGKLAPGNSVDTITVTQLTLNPNSTYQVELNATRADQTIVTTGQTLRTGKVSVIREAGHALVASDFKDRRYVIIQSQLGTQTGTFAAADVAFDTDTALEFPSYAPRVEMNDKQTILYFQLTQNFGTPRTISSLPNIMGRTQSMFVHSITGDPYARLLARGPSSARGVSQNSLLSSKDDLDESISGAFDNTWVEGYAQAVQAHQGSGIWGYDYQLGGVSAGIDLIRDKEWVMGLAFGMSQSEAKHEYNHDKTSSTAYDLGLYTAASGDDSTVSFVAFYSNYDVTHTRQVDMGTTIRPATGKPKAFRTGVELGYDTNVFRTPDSKTYLRMGLGAGLAHRNGFTETGEDAIIMNFDAVNMPYFQLDIGMGYSTDLFEGDKSWQIFGEGMFTRHVVSSNPTCQARFVNAVGSSGEVTVPSPEYTYMQFQPSIGVSWREGLGSAEFKVFAEIRGGKTAPGASASYKLRF